MHALSRRAWLKIAGTAAFGLPMISSASPDLRARARKNLKLGVFTGVYASLPLEEAARRIAADGFHGVILEYAFADVRFDPWAPDWDKARLIKDTLAKHDLKIVGLFGYYNVVDPDTARRQKGEQRMQMLIENWKQDYNQIRPHSALGHRPNAPEAIMPRYGSTTLILSAVE